MKSILIVDDEYAIVDVLSVLLAEEGYQVFTACNGNEGLKKLSEVHPDLILLDVMMPFLDGPSMFELLRSNPQFATLPVIFMSAACQFDLELKNAKHADFLAKPFEVDRLLSLIQTSLRL